MVTDAEQENTAGGFDDKKEHYHFFRMTRKILLAGMGAAALAQDEVEDFINRLVDRGEIAEKDGRSLIHEMMEKRKAKFSKVEDEAARQVEKALNRMNMPSKADLDALSEKIAALARKVDELKHDPD